jgi:predicted transcriptional regulator
MYKALLDELYRMPVSQVMRTEGFAVIPGDTAIEVVLEMLLDSSRIWVYETGRSSRVVGVVTRKDFLDMALPPRTERSIPGRVQQRTLYFDGAVVTAEEMMTKKIVTLNENATVLDALNLMRGEFVRSLPVVKDGELIGELSLRDLISKLLQLAERGRETGAIEE